MKVELRNQRNGDVYTAYSNSVGNYSIIAVIDRPYTFQIVKDGYYGFTMTNFEPICDESRNIDICLHKFQY